MKINPIWLTLTAFVCAFSTQAAPLHELKFPPTQQALSVPHSAPPPITSDRMRQAPARQQPSKAWTEKFNSRNDRFKRLLKKLEKQK